MPTLSFNSGGSQKGRRFTSKETDSGRDSETCLKAPKLNKWWIRIKASCFTPGSALSTVSHHQKQTHEDLRDPKGVYAAGESHCHTNLVLRGFPWWKMNPPVQISTFYRCFCIRVYATCLHTIYKSLQECIVIHPFSSLLLFLKCLTPKELLCLPGPEVTVVCAFISGMFNLRMLRLKFPLFFFSHVQVFFPTSLVLFLYFCLLYIVFLDLLIISYAVFVKVLFLLFHLL